MANTYGSSNSKRGFASMSKDRVKEIASMGGQPHISRVLPMNLIQQKLEKLVVAGVVLNDAGEPVEVIYNDSVAGCNQRMDAKTFGDKVQTNAATNVTKEPVF